MMPRDGPAASAVVLLPIAQERKRATSFLDRAHEAIPLMHRSSRGGGLAALALRSGRAIRTRRAAQIGTGVVIFQTALTADQCGKRTSRDPIVDRLEHAVDTARVEQWRRLRLICCRAGKDSGQELPHAHDLSRPRRVPIARTL